jgi:thioredoxin 1
MTAEITGTGLQDQFQTEVLDSKELVLVDFWAPWCGPCKNIAPVLDRLATKFEGKLTVIKVNVDEEEAQSIAAEYGVRGIPNLILFKGGKQVAQQVGAQSESVLTEWVESHLST